MCLFVGALVIAGLVFVLAMFAFNPRPKDWDNDGQDL